MQKHPQTAPTSAQSHKCDPMQCSTWNIRVIKAAARSKKRTDLVTMFHVEHLSEQGAV